MKKKTYQKNSSFSLTLHYFPKNLLVNKHEPRYVDMINDSMKTNKLIG